jgi:ABC-type spermidine/putrescine transport system permease subunit II
MHHRAKQGGATELSNYPNLNGLRLLNKLQSVFSLLLLLLLLLLPCLMIIYYSLQEARIQEPLVQIPANSKPNFTYLVKLHNILRKCLCASVTAPT